MDREAELRRSVVDSLTKGRQNWHCLPVKHPSAVIVTCVMEELNAQKCQSQQKTLLNGFCAFLEECPANWLFTDLKTDGIIIYERLISTLTNSATLTTGSINEDEAYKEDFTDITSKATIVFKILISFITKLDDFSHLGQEEADFRTAVLKNTLVDCVVLSAAYIGHHEWSNETTNKYASDLLERLCQVCYCDSIQELLCGCKSGIEEKTGTFIKKGIYRKVLQKLRPRLTRDTWKLEPASRHVYKWCLLHVKLQNKIHGIQCLHHIINNVDPTELKWYGRAMVIYEALHKQIYSREPALLDELYPCLVDLLGVIERSPRKTDQPRKTNRYDEILQITLTNMEMEQQIILRRIYSKHLHLFVEKMGITVVRHFKRLLRVVVEYLEVYDGPEETSRINMLKLLCLVVMETWPRMPNHVDMLLKSLLRLTFDMATDESTTPDNVKQTVLDFTTKCLVVLRKCCRQHVDSCFQEVSSIVDNETVLRCINEVISKPNDSEL
ncbi:TELO2-interacting protein 2-like isoform X2 [Ptychodera flava]|uniref:TELO2-interacting protein 2-like isoform X2 n=1 Tax=Ptychodera flava TaxID=63121 RepID=UPI00396AAFD0